MIDVEKTIISQYADSPTIRQMIANTNSYIDPAANLNDFYNYVWNVDTAQGFGLDIWGRIVNVGRYLQVPGSSNYFGFSQGGFTGFGQAPFYGQFLPTVSYRLSDDQYRKLIYLKAISNITSCTIPAINQQISNYFAGRGSCYVGDIGSMLMTYIFNFVLDPYEFAIVKNGNALPRPSGVQIIVEQSPSLRGRYFGFSQAQYPATGFGQGPFSPALPI